MGKAKEELVHVFYHNTTYGDSKLLPTSPRTGASPVPTIHDMMNRLVSSCIVGTGQPRPGTMKATPVLAARPVLLIILDDASPYIVGTGLAPVLGVGQGGLRVDGLGHGVEGWSDLTDRWLGWAAATPISHNPSASSICLNFNFIGLSRIYCRVCSSS
jgi:hypothetical protein